MQFKFTFYAQFVHSRMINTILISLIFGSGKQAYFSIIKKETIHYFSLVNTPKGGGGLVQSLRRSYSLSDLSEPDTVQRSQDDIDVVMRPQRIQRTKNTRSMPAAGRGDVNMSFPELDLQTKHRGVESYQ